MIPKVIHYCWFGRNPKSLLVQRCIKSWKKFCPDYEIIEWNEENFDISINEYVEEAYKEKKWAFVTDYARLWIVYNYGGIYLDTDVELIKPLDGLLQNSAYFASEDGINISTGLGFGAEKNNIYVETMMHGYDNKHFLKSDGAYDMLPCPIRNTNDIRFLLPDLFRIDVKIQLDDVVLYPPEYFCPLSNDGTNMKKTNNTYSIHWFNATWLSKEEKIVHDYRVFRGKCKKYLGEKLGDIFARIIYLFLPSKRKILKKYS